VNVGGILIPLEDLTSWSLEGVPSVSSLGDAIIDFLEHLRLDNGLSDLLDFIS
jgi:hypothetical protein